MCLPSFVVALFCDGFQGLIVLYSGLSGQTHRSAPTQGQTHRSAPTSGHRHIGLSLHEVTFI